MNTRNQTLSIDDPSKDQISETEGFLNSLGFGSDVLKDIDDLDSDGESNDGLMLSSQQENFSLPGVTSYQIPKRFGLEDLQFSNKPVSRKTLPAEVADKASDSSSIGNVPDAAKVEIYELEEPVSVSLEPNEKEIEKIIDSSVEFEIPPTAKVQVPVKEEEKDDIETEAASIEEPALEESDPIEEPEPENAADEVKKDDSIYLSCPKCKGELTLQTEHLGVQGNCVWCEIPIVAAKSPANGSISVFALEAPDTDPVKSFHDEVGEEVTTLESLSEKLPPSQDLVAEEPVSETPDATLNSSAPLAEEEDDKEISAYRPELPEHVVAAEIQIPESAAPEPKPSEWGPPATTLSPAPEPAATDASASPAPASLEIAEPPPSEPASPGVAEAPSPEPEAIFFADPVAEAEAPAPAETPLPAQPAALTQVSPFDPPSSPSPEPPAEATPAQVGPAPASVPATTPEAPSAETTPTAETPPPSSEFEAAATPFTMPSPFGAAPSSVSPTEGPVSSFQAPTPNSVGSIETTSEVLQSNPVVEIVEDEENTANSPWGKPFQTPTVPFTPSQAVAEAAAPVEKLEETPPAETGPSTSSLLDLLPIENEGDPIEEDDAEGFKIASPVPGQPVSSFSDLPVEGNSPFLKSDNDAPPSKAVSEPGPPEDVPQSFPSPFGKKIEEIKAKTSEPKEPRPEPATPPDDAPPEEAPPEDEKKEEILTPPEDPPKKSQSGISSGFSPDNPPPMAGGVLIPTGPGKTDAKSKPSGASPAASASKKAGKSKKKKSSLPALLVIMGLVTGVCVASFLLPVDEYVAKVRAYVDEKFEEDITTPAVQPGELPAPPAKKSSPPPSGGPPSPSGPPSLPRPPQSNLPKSP